MIEHVKYLLIGSGPAAYHAACGIRERDRTGRLLMVGDEPDLPYARPHLSGAYLAGRRDRSSLMLQPADFYASQLEAEVRPGVSVSRLDARRNTAELADGTTVTFERALLATGSKPIRLAVPGGNLPGIHYLHTLTQVDAVRAALVAARRVVIIGGEPAGVQAAAALAQLGLRITLLLPGEAILKPMLGPGAGRFLTDYFADHGVAVLKHTRPGAVEAKRHELVVELVDGVKVPADLVLVDVGCAPRVELAHAASLAVDQGVLVDECLRSSDPSIYAAGDIAQYPDRRYDRRLRLESWDNAAATGQIAGRNMAGANQPLDHLPYLNVSLFDLDLQAWGDLYRWDRVIARGTLGHQLTYFYVYHDRVVAALAVNPGADDAAVLPRLVAAQPTVADACAFGDVSVPFERLMETPVGATIAASS